jgi:hypothetical protein
MKSVGKEYSAQAQTMMQPRTEKGEKELLLISARAKMELCSIT